ncbi:MAG: transposase [Methanobrevibacter sp.]|nr:transposase [Methanobrevibacter sp.]
MLPGLNYTKRCRKFRLLDKVFINIDDKKNRHIFSENGIKNIKMMITCIKIVFLSKFYDYPVSRVIYEISIDNRLKRFLKIENEVPSEAQVYEYLSRYSPDQYNNISNSFFKLFLKLNKSRKSDWIVDATPVACDINILKKYVSPEHLEKLDLDMGFSTTKGYFIGFKATVVLEKDTLCPISVIIHSGAKNDSKIFEEVLEELNRRRILKKGQVILFDKGYYSMENYINAINKYSVVAVIFPRQWFTLEKLEARMSTSLDIFYDKTTLEDDKNLFLELTTKLYNKLKNWEDLKPTRGIIEDFFKVCKDAFGLGEFHSYTQSSMRRNIYLCILLSTLVIQQGFDTKTKLQQLAEGRIDLEPIKSRKSKKPKENNETTENQEVGEKTDAQTTLITKKEEQSALDLFA